MTKMVRGKEKLFGLSVSKDNNSSGVMTEPNPSCYLFETW